MQIFNSEAFLLLICPYVRPSERLDIFDNLDMLELSCCYLNYASEFLWQYSPDQWESILYLNL